METLLEKSRQLVKGHTHLLNIGRRFKMRYWTENDDYEINFFDSSFDHLYDIYETRLMTNKDWGNYTDGLEELVRTMEQNRHLPEIRLTSFSSKKDYLMLFSDPEYSVFLGFLIFDSIQCPATLKDFLIEAFEEFQAFLEKNPILGREQEIKNAFLHNILAKKCQPHAPLFDMAQVCLEGAVKQRKKVETTPNPKNEVNADMVIWAKPNQTCFNKKGKVTQFPLAIIEWKVAYAWGKGASKTDFEDNIDKMQKYKAEYPEPLCCAVFVDMRNKEISISLKIDSDEIRHFKSANPSQLSI